MFIEHIPDYRRLNRVCPVEYGGVWGTKRVLSETSPNFLLGFSNEIYSTREKANSIMYVVRSISSSCSLNSLEVLFWRSPILQKTIISDGARGRTFGCLVLLPNLLLTLGWKRFVLNLKSPPLLLTLPAVTRAAPQMCILFIWEFVNNYYYKNDIISPAENFLFPIRN